MIYVLKPSAEKNLVPDVGCKKTNTNYMEITIVFNREFSHKSKTDTDGNTEKGKRFHTQLKLRECPAVDVNNLRDFEIFCAIPPIARLVRTLPLPPTTQKIYFRLLYSLNN